MSTRQLEANRRNAAKSTGPKTQAGKASSSRNACTHGFTATTVVLSTEDGSLFEQLRQELHAELCPVGLIETDLVDEIAAARWRQRRCATFETVQLNHKIRERAADFGNKILSLDKETQAATAFKTIADFSKGLRDASLYECRHRRIYEKAMKELAARQKLRQQSEQVEEIEASTPDPEPPIEKVKNEPIPENEHYQIDPLGTPRSWSEVLKSLEDRPKAS